MASGSGASEATVHAGSTIASLLSSSLLSRFFSTRPTAVRRTARPGQVVVRVNSEDSMRDGLPQALLRHFSGASNSPPASTDAADTGQQEETPAAAAQRHRMENSVGVDLQSLALWSEKSGPFVLVLIFIFIYQHWRGLALFAWITALVALANEFTKKQIALKEGKKRAQLLGVAMLLLAHEPLLFLALLHHQAWRSLALMLPDAVPTTWDCLYIVTLTDGAVRILCQAVKLLVVLSARSTPEEAGRRRGQIFCLVEQFFLLYRALATSPAWYVYFYRGAGLGFMASVFTGAFFFIKASVTYETMKQFIACARALIQDEAQYGQYITQEEDPMSKPLKLRCSHVFCDSCISEWFERESTCPMCRAQVRPAGICSNDGTTSLLPQIF